MGFSNLENPHGDVGGAFNPGQMIGDDGELIAAETSDQVVIPRCRAQTTGGRNDQIVAFCVAKKVVDQFEPVEVEHEDGMNFVWPTRQIDCRAQGRFKMTPVGQAG
jgi:hypothetical protein